MENHTVNQKLIKETVEYILDYYIKDTKLKPEYRDIIRQIKMNDEVKNMIIENINRFLQPEYQLLTEFINENPLDTEYEKYLKLQFLEQVSIVPKIINLTHQTLFNESSYKIMLENFYTEHYESIIKTLSKYNDSEEINRELITEDLSLMFGFLFGTAVGKALLGTITLILFTILALENRWFNRLWLKVSGYIKSLGETLKDVQKDNLIIEKFFDNIPPECFKKFKDIETILIKDLGKVGVGIKDPKDLEKYSPETMNEIKKKLLSIDFFKWGIWNKQFIKQTEATDCTIRYLISNLGIALTIFYKCLYKNAQIKQLNEILNIKEHDLLMSKGDILDVFANSINTACLVKYKEFKKQLKFILDLLEALYKDDYKRRALYNQLLIDTIKKAQQEGQKLLSKINKNNAPKDNKRTNNNKKEVRNKK